MGELSAVTTSAFSMKTALPLRPRPVSYKILDKIVSKMYIYGAPRLKVYAAEPPISRISL
eukprot:XP_001703853.1 Hypothetical protein GL50803_115438 [Giardia lamblia ATCC 50803]